jgi:hypothetical protein
MISMSDHKGRSYEVLDKGDLSKLSEVVIAKLREKSKPIENQNLACMALMQNGARHYLDPNDGPGLHDFDVICLFKELVSETRERPITTESGLTKFGKCLECRDSETKKVDIFCKKLPIVADTVEVNVKSYFKEARTKWISCISERPCIGIWPPELCGKTLWEGRAAGTSSRRLRAAATLA